MIDHAHRPVHSSAGRPAVQALSSWHQDVPIPETLSGTRLVLVLDSLRALSAVRRQVRAFLVSGCGAAPAAAYEDVVERAVLVVDEMTSNALRHGLPPSSLQVYDEPGIWLLVVRDAAPDRLPEPAVDRPAGQGGYGLHVIADLTSQHGVHHGTDHKLVWACLAKPAA